MRSIGERMTGSGALFGAADLVLGITGDSARLMRVRRWGATRRRPSRSASNSTATGMAHFGGSHTATPCAWCDRRHTASRRCSGAAQGERGRDRRMGPLAADARRSPERDQGTVRHRRSDTRARRDEMAVLGVTYQDVGRLSVYAAVSQTRLSTDEAIP